MRVAIEAGAEIDFATPEEVRQIVRGELSRRPTVSKKLRGAGVMPSTGILAIDLGSPVAGMLWDLRNVFVAGIDPSATVTNAIALIGIGAVPASGSLITNATDPTSFIQRLATVPNNATFSREQATIGTLEHLFVVFVAAAATTELVVGAEVVQTPQRTAEGFEW